MNPFDALSKTLQEQDVAQAQREALVDLVVWTMYVDGAIKYEENEQVDEVVSRLDLFADLPLSQYLFSAIAKFRDVWHDHARSVRVLDEIAARLRTEEMRRTAYVLSEAVARADGELAEAERAFLSQVRRQFELEAD